MNDVNELKTKYFEVNFGEVTAYTLSIKVKDLITLGYVAIRGVDLEKGAVQRILSRGRIENIKNYILEGNQFFNSFIINWTEKNYKIEIKAGEIIIPLVPDSAQIIDGQHRLEGLKVAAQEQPEIGEQKVIVTLCNLLDTKDAAKIFLNINTEQKPVPKSLIYDLFGELDDNKNHAIIRATDIAKDLNDDPKSALYKMIKFPGAPRGSGTIELSTFVSAIKAALEPKGKFNSIKLDQFNHQRAVINNYFEGIQHYYRKEGIWENKSKNPFMMASGLNGAIDFLVNTLIEKCAERKSFEVDTMLDYLHLDNDDLLTRQDLKGTDGKTAKKMVEDYLGKYITNSYVNSDEYSF